MNNKIRIAAIALSLASLILSFLLLVRHVNEKALAQLPSTTEQVFDLYINPATPWNKGVVATSRPKVEFLSTEHTTEETEITGEETPVTEPHTETPEPDTELQTEEPATVTEPATEPVQITEESRSSNSGFIGTMYITGYTAEEGFQEGSATASGYGVRPGYCALNNSQRQSLGISYGDKIYIEGLGTYTVMDCGCSWGVVDVWVYTNAEAYTITGNYAVYYA